MFVLSSLLACLGTYPFLTYLLTCLLACLLAYLLASFLAYFLAYLLAHLLAYLLALDTHTHTLISRFVLILLLCLWQENISSRTTQNLFWECSQTNVKQTKLQTR